jgi:hypothetical protein
MTARAFGYLGVLLEDLKLAELAHNESVAREEIQRTDDMLLEPGFADENFKAREALSAILRERDRRARVSQAKLLLRLEL